MTNSRICAKLFSCVLIKLEIALTTFMFIRYDVNKKQTLTRPTRNSELCNQYHEHTLFLLKIFFVGLPVVLHLNGGVEAKKLELQ